ncbi:MAG: hypothetical protein IJ831_02260 [Spirochaetales bacterium]|nr:hypothetical protein [Spirochaetales bacterium]
MSVLSGHICEGAILRHDSEHSHRAQVKELGLISETWSSKELRKVPDNVNPLDSVNEACAMLKGFLRSHSIFLREDLQDYLNLFSFILNPPHDKFRKVENFISRVLGFPALHRYRG